VDKELRTSRLGLALCNSLNVQSPQLTTQAPGTLFGRNGKKSARAFPSTLVIRPGSPLVVLNVKVCRSKATELTVDHGILTPAAGSSRVGSDILSPGDYKASGLQCRIGSRWTRRSASRAALRSLTAAGTAVYLPVDFVVCHGGRSFLEAEDSRGSRGTGGHARPNWAHNGCHHTFNFVPPAAEKDGVGYALSYYLIVCSLENKLAGNE